MSSETAMAGAPRPPRRSRSPWLAVGLVIGGLAATELVVTDTSAGGASIADPGDGVDDQRRIGRRAVLPADLPGARADGDRRLRSGLVLSSDLETIAPAGHSRPPGGRLGDDTASAAR